MLCVTACTVATPTAIPTAALTANEQAAQGLHAYTSNTRCGEMLLGPTRINAEITFVTNNSMTLTSPDRISEPNVGLTYSCLGQNVWTATRILGPLPFTYTLTFNSNGMVFNVVAEGAPPDCNTTWVRSD